MLHIPTALTLLSTVAYAIFTVAGAVLWKRTRSLQTALVLHYVSILGLWIAAVGMVWHAAEKSAPPGVDG